MQKILKEEGKQLGSDKDSTITAEVDGRLDDLFGDGDGQGDSFASQEDAEAGNFAGEAEYEVQNGNLKAGNNTGSGDSMINDLKSVVLSLEWEISDQVMQKLGEEIDTLKGVCKDDKIVVAFLQLLDSLGKYIQKKKADAHPDSIGLLNSVYEHLETVLASPEMSEAKKKKMLVTEVGKYKELKKDIATAKPPVSRRPEEKPAGKKVLGEKPFPEPEAHTSSFLTEEEDVVSVSSFPSGTASNQDVVLALKEINKTIKTEFKALREELKLWREKA